MVATTRESKRLNIPTVHEGSSFQSESSRMFGAICCSPSLILPPPIFNEIERRRRAICEYPIPSEARFPKPLRNEVAHGVGRDCRRADLNKNTGAEGFRYSQISMMTPRTPDSRKRLHRRQSRQGETGTVGHA